MRPGPKLADFEGVWRLDREVIDRLSGAEGQLEGEARFAWRGDFLVYDEEGTLVLDGRRFHAERRYLWREEPDGITICYEDARPFHAIGPGLGPAARHDCPPDVYEVAYDFTDWPEWRADWHVRGPNKDYRLLSRYRRGEDGAAEA